MKASKVTQITAMFSFQTCFLTKLNILQNKRSVVCTVLYGMKLQINDQRVFPVKKILKVHNPICPVMIKRLNMSQYALFVS